MTAIFKIANKSTAFLYIKNWKNAYIEIINKVGARRCPSSNYQSRCCSSDRKARHSCRCSRYHRREPPSARAFIPYNLRVTYFRFQRGRCFPGMHMLGSFAGEASGGENPPVPLEMVIFLPEGARRGPSTKHQSRRRRPERKARHSRRCPRYHRREPPPRLRRASNNHRSMPRLSLQQLYRFRFLAIPDHIRIPSRVLPSSTQHIQP